MVILTEKRRMEMMSFYYNQALAWKRPVVLTYKRPDLQEGTATIDLERSRMADIYPDPWLTDTSVASSSWAYASDIKYYPTNRMVDDLVDIISKNGCMLLNIAPAADGTIPTPQRERLLGIGAWLKINGEAIYATRPWRIVGEGPAKTPQGHLADLKFKGFTAADIRFTRSKDATTLYAIALGWPESRTLTVRALAGGKGVVQSVRLLGHSGKLTWTQTDKGLVVNLPATAPCEHAFVLKITGKGL